MTIGQDTTATSYLDGSSVDDIHQHDDLSDLQNALDELEKAFPDYQEAESFYDGTAPEFFASHRLRRALAAAGNPYGINFAKKPVNLIAEKLTIASVTVPDNPAANEALQAIWKRNKLQIELKDMLLRAGEYGDAYVIVWPAFDDDGDIVGVDIFYNSPHCCRVFYDTENPLVKAFAIKKWVWRNRIRVNLYYLDRLEKYVSRDGRIHQVTATELQPWYDNVIDPTAGDDEPQWPLDNPYGGLPVFHLRNKNPYGVPEHKDFYGTQQIITKLIMGHMATSDYYQSPQRYALADPDVDGSDAEDDEFGIPNDDSDDSDDDAAADDPTAQLSADPGSVWLLRGMKAVGQFDVADPKGFLDPMLTYLRMGAQVSDMPVNRIDPTGAAQSGDSRRIMAEPFNRKVGDRKTRYTDTLREIFQFALNILGFPDADVVITWDPVESVDDLDGWNIVRAKIENGMPPSEAFLQAGCTKEQVDLWFPADTDADLPARVELLLKIGQALQALGAASGFQLIEPVVIQNLVDALLGGLDEQTAGETGPEPPPATAPPPVGGGGGDRTSQPD